MASLHDKKYNKWDKIAKEELAAHDEEEKLEEEQAKKDLGLNAPMSKDEANERAKHKQAMDAKAALDKHREFEEGAKCIIADKENETINLNAAALEKKKIITLKGLKGCTVNIPQDGKIVLVKVFIEGCENTIVTISARLLTSHVEMTHCNEMTLNANNHVLSTVQLDICDGIVLNYNENTFGVIDEVGDCNDRIYHAGVKNMTVNVSMKDGKKLTQKCDYLTDGAVAIAEASPEEYQFVTQILKETKELVTDRLLRVGPKFLTQREIDASGGETATTALEMASDEVGKIWVPASASLRNEFPGLAV